MKSYVEKLKLTIDILSNLTNNTIHYTPLDGSDNDPIVLPKKSLGMTKNNHPIRSMFNLPTDWTIYYKNPIAIPHEICHVIDSLSTYKQTSLKKDFEHLYEDFRTNWFNYDKEPIADNYREYIGQHSEVFARLLNAHLYVNKIIPLPPISAGPGDYFAHTYYMENRDVVDAYFNNRFGFLDKIDTLNTDNGKNANIPDFTEESIQNMSFEELYSHLDLSGTNLQQLGESTLGLNI